MSRPKKSAYTPLSIDTPEPMGAVAPSPGRTSSAASSQWLLTIMAVMSVLGCVAMLSLLYVFGLKAGGPQPAVIGQANPPTQTISVILTADPGAPNSWC